MSQCYVCKKETEEPHRMVAQEQEDKPIYIIHLCDSCFEAMREVAELVADG